MFDFPVPPKTCQIWAEDSLLKTVLNRGVRRKMFNPGLMNKLIGME